MTTARWLEADEQQAWRAYLHGAQRLDVLLDRDLRAVGLTLSEYEVLAMASEAPADEPLRMSQLAARVVQSRSRLTHTANRLESRGLVRRTECADDRRGVKLELTPLGAKCIAEAAPVHVESVRRHLMDLMSHEEFVQLGMLMQRVDQQAGGRAHR